MTNALDFRTHDQGRITGIRERQADDRHRIRTATSSEAEHRKTRHQVEVEPETIEVVLGRADRPIVCFTRTSAIRLANVAPSAGMKACVSRTPDAVETSRCRREACAVAGNHPPSRAVTL